MIEIDDRRFTRLALSGVIIGFALLFTALIAVLLTMQVNQRSAAWVNHTYRVVDELKQLELYVERAETASRGYLVAPDPARIVTFRNNVGPIPATVNRLATMTSDNPVERANIARLRPALNAEMGVLHAIMAQATAGQIEQARSRFAQEIKYQRVNRIRAITGAMRQEEDGLLTKRSVENDRTARVLYAILAITGVLLILFAVAVIVIVRRYTASLLTARNRLNRLNTDLEGAVAERTADLQRANDEIQRFAYIVSHDLRSPLVNILGFTAELEETNKSLVALLERAEADAPHIITPDSQAARQDLPEAIGFIRTSTQKMDRLINAILRLSREGRRNLTPEPLAMDSIFGDIVANLEHRLTETGTKVEIEAHLPDIVSDRVAIEQIFSNLIENAVKYQEPDQPAQIRVRGSVKADRIVYEVEDNGRGIDPKDHQRVFDLFRRSGIQDKPGEGIGLAHVRALAYRLGGFIDLKSALGQGATFLVNLPAAYTAEGVKN